MPAVNQPARSNPPLHWFIGVAIVTTLFLFYIDEGYYNFEWMKDPGNWMAFVIYSASIFAGQLLIYLLLASKRQGLDILALSILLGTAISLTLLIGFLLHI